MSREILVKSHRRLAMCSQSWGTWWAAVLIPSWTVSKVRESRVHCRFRDKSEGQVAAALGSVFTLEFTGKHADLKQGHSGENLLSFLASLLPPKGLETTANKSGRGWWRKREETEHALPPPPSSSAAGPGESSLTFEWRPKCRLLCITWHYNFWIVALFATLNVQMPLY